MPPPFFRCLFLRMGVSIFPTPVTPLPIHWHAERRLVDSVILLSHHHSHDSRLGKGSREPSGNILAMLPYREEQPMPEPIQWPAPSTEDSRGSTMRTRPSPTVLSGLLSGSLKGLLTGALLPALSLSSLAFAAPELHQDLHTAKTQVTAQAPRLATAFEQASREFGVPTELLMAVSYTVTSWNDAQGYDAHSAREFGVMGLRMQTEGPTLEEAARLLNLEPEQLISDQTQNIRGGAALLASYAREVNAGTPVQGELRLETAPLWWNAVAQYAGLLDARQADMFAVHVFETLDRGMEGRADSGELIRLLPTSLPSVIGEWIQDARYQYKRQVEAMTPQVDYAGAAWVAACSSNYSNYSRTAADIAYVVIHKIEGSYSGCISWFQNCSAQVSAHYVVSKNGDVTQMVKEEDIAWHAGNWDYNEASVGIEHEGYTAKDDVTDAEYRASAELTKDICNRNGIAKTRSYIIGHNEVPGATHTDPGPYWDWDYYMQLVGGTGGGTGTGGTSTGNLVGVIKADDIYTGAPISGATVTLNTGASVKTDSGGNYKFTGLAAGTYTATATAACYKSSSITKTVTAGVDNWASMPMFEDGSCTNGDGTADSTDDASSCRMMGPDLPTTRIHTASTSPLDRLPWNTAGFVIGLGSAVILYRRRRS